MERSSHGWGMYSVKVALDLDLYLWSLVEFVFGIDLQELIFMERSRVCVWNRFASSLWSFEFEF